MNTVLDRYIGLSDNAVSDASAFADMVSLFASEATVTLFGDPVHGHQAIVELYRGFTSTIAESKHFWRTTVLENGVLEAFWVSASRRTDGRLVIASGVEHATVTADGLIIELHNIFTHPA